MLVEIPRKIRSIHPSLSSFYTCWCSIIITIIIIIINKIITTIIITITIIINWWSQMLQIPLSDEHCNNHIVALGILGLFLTDGLWVKAINWECTLVYINPECFRYRSVPIISHKPFCTKTQQNWIDKWPPSPTSPPALSEHMYGG